MKQIYANNFTTLDLGLQGENIARQLVFDIRDLESLYGSGTNAHRYRNITEDKFMNEIIMAFITGGIIMISVLISNSKA